MWEWSNHICKPKETETKATSLLSAYDDLISSCQPIYSNKHKQTKAKTPNEKTQEKISTITTEEMERLVRNKIEEFNLKNINIIECSYEPQSWVEMNKSFAEYQRTRLSFLKLIAYSNTKECIDAGLTKNDLSLLKQGITPENFNTHIKIPFDFGGESNVSNMALVKTHPTHTKIHQVIDMQIDNNFLRIHKKIFIPHFEGKIYHD